MTAGEFFKRKVLSRFERRSVSERILYAIVFVVFAALAFTYVYCLFWCFMSGFKTHGEVVLKPFALPEKWHFENYAEMMDLLKVRQTGFFGMIMNSVYFSVLGAFISTTCTCMLAYVTCKYKFPFAGLYFVGSLIMMILPIYGTGGSMYLLLDKLGIMNSPWMILTSTAGMGVNYMYFHAFYQNMSWSYAEAAQIDGAGDYGIFFRIMLPQSLPMFGAIFVLIWMAEWNNYSTALLYLSKMPTLAVGIFLFQQDMTHYARMDILYAACFVSSIPPIVIFACFNKILMSNISLGGIKE